MGLSWDHKLTPGISHDPYRGIFEKILYRCEIVKEKSHTGNINININIPNA